MKVKNMPILQLIGERMDIISSKLVKVAKSLMLKICELKNKIKPYVIYYVIWLLMNVVVGLFPILSDVLDGKSAPQIYPSLLLVYVVMLASSTHMFFKRKNEDIDIKATLHFSVAMVWIILLILLSTKFPYKNYFNGVLLDDNNIVVLMVMISIISIVIAAIIYFPFIEIDVKSNIEKEKIRRTQSDVKKQELDQFDHGDL